MATIAKSLCFTGLAIRPKYTIANYSRHWRRGTINFTYLVALSDEDGDWGGETGFVHELAERHFDNQFGGHKAYLCGPPPMIDACITSLMRGRLCSKSISSWKISSRQLTPRNRHGAVPCSKNSRSARWRTPSRFKIAARHSKCDEEQNVLAAMERLGRKGIPVGCRGGGCGVCRVQVTYGHALDGGRNTEPLKMSKTQVSDADRP